jgi:hypothetical protein
MDSKSEAAHERRDRHWRRWKEFLRDWGLVSDPYLDTVPNDGERVLLARGFILRHRTFDFDPEGRAAAEREKPMVSSTIRDAISSVASAFRQRGRSSPFHIQNGVNDAGSIHPKVRALLKGFESLDLPPAKQQKAVTPALLRDLYSMAGKMTTCSQHTADLILGAYFFAMRACEFCETERPGKTKKLTPRNVTFRDASSRLVSNTDPELAAKAAFVTICFVDQKNGTKMEKRSQRRSGERILCPVAAWASVVERVIRDFPEESIKEDLPVCAYKVAGRRGEITSSQVIRLLRTTCQVYDGENRYGISESEIGTRSIRSGAAMALAVQGNASDKKIMMLGRWKSLAFLNYIRPQVLEWAGSASSDMTKVKRFLDIGDRQTPRTKTRKSTTPQQPDNTGEDEIPSFPLFDL